MIVLSFGCYGCCLFVVYMVLLSRFCVYLLGGVVVCLFDFVFSLELICLLLAAGIVLVLIVWGVVCLIFLWFTLVVFVFRWFCVCGFTFSLMFVAYCVRLCCLLNTFYVGWLNYGWFVIVWVDDVSGRLIVLIFLCFSCVCGLFVYLIFCFCGLLICTWFGFVAIGF